MAKIQKVSIGNNTYSIAIPYAVCGTAADTVAKTVNTTAMNGVTLTEGTQIKVKFTNGNTAGAPTLKVNSLTAKTIKASTSSGISANKWSEGCVLDLVYDGTY